MEELIVFINLRKFHSKSKNEDYYTIEYVMVNEQKPYTEFITEETYNNIKSKDPKFLQKYKAIFKMGDNKKLVINQIMV